VCQILIFALAVIGYVFFMFGFYTVSWATAEYPTDEPGGWMAQWFFGLWEECYSSGTIFRCRQVWQYPTGYPVWFGYFG